MTTPLAGAPIGMGWLPATAGRVFLVLLLLLGFSWWLTGRFFRERDGVTLVFRGLMSVLFCIGIGFFNQSLVHVISTGPLAPAFETKAEKDARLRKNMQQWMAPAAFDAYWSSTADDLRKLKQMSPAEWKEYKARRLPPKVLVESAMRGLTWMALEHRNPSKFGRMAFPHAERGTKVLNDLTAPQAQAMFDYILIVSPLSEPDTRPCLNDALAFCLEATGPAVPGAASGEPAANPDARPYPSIEASRETSHGRAFVVRLSATETRVIEAGSEEEALKAARKP